MHSTDSLFSSEAQTPASETYGSTLDNSPEETDSESDALIRLNQELKNKVAELSQANSDLQSLMVSTGIPTIFLSSKLRVERYTPSAAALLSLSTDDNGLPFAELQHGFESQRLIQDSQQVLQTQTLIEREIQASDGRWFLLRILPYQTNRIESGVSLTFIEMTQWRQNDKSWREPETDSGANLNQTTSPINEPKQAEQARCASEGRFHAIVNQATAIVVEMDLTGKFIFANQTFCKATGYTEAEIFKLRWNDITHPEDRPHCLEIFGKAVSSHDSYFNEKRIICKDGSHLWTSDSVSGIRDTTDKPQSVVAVMIDVTERKRIEDALRESEEQYRAIIDQASVGILQCDLTGRIQVANDHAGIQLGYTTEELLQSRVQDLTHRDDIPFSMEKFVFMVTQGVPVEVEKRCIRKDGSYLWASASVSPIRDAQGNPQGASVIIVDITQRQQAQEELRRAHDELELRVQERTQELALALQHVHEEVGQRQKAEAVRDKLLRQIVHTQEEERRRLSRELHDNMGQHLTAILLAVQALEAQNQSKSPDDRRTVALNLIRLRGMVDELLNVSHRLAWEIRPALLDNIGLKAALEQYIINWSQKSGIQSDFVSRVPGEKTSLPAEAETALFRVAQEALTNVQRHSLASQVSVVLERNEDSVAIIVEDNGQGFDIENNDYSTRLGLLGIQERLELVGGTLTLESSENTGLTVYARVSLSN